MTVGARRDDVSLNDVPDLNVLANLNVANGRLLTVIAEKTVEEGEVAVTLTEQWGEIHADLSIGANVASAEPLKANENLSNRGVQLFGAGFIVTPEEATAFTLQGSQNIIREYRNGRDLTEAPRGVKVIDAFGLSAEQLRTQFPDVYQWLLERVKPERDQNNRASYRDSWWIHGEPRKVMRKQLAGLPRYIATVETAKHRTFQFVDASILPDNMLIAIASNDALHLGILSSRAHAAWAWANGGSIGMYVGNVRYNKSRCFETFPFPDQDTGLTPALRQRITTLAEQIDAHRKHQQAMHTGLTLTGMYNVLEALHEGRELTTKEKTIHTQGLVAVLKELHDELDAAVLQAYGLQANMGTDELLTHLVALNARRAAEEKTGHVRWLRPEFQNPATASAQAAGSKQAEMPLETPQKKMPAGKSSETDTSQVWPASLPDQVRALALVLGSQPGVLTIADIETRFKGRGPWKKSLPRILDTLAAVGRARREGDGWRA